METPSPSTQSGFKESETDLQAMDKELPFIRCPCCGSLLTSPMKGTKDMWECRYHLCRAIFPVFPGDLEEQAALVAEGEPGYDRASKRKRRG